MEDQHLSAHDDYRSMSYGGICLKTLTPEKAIYPEFKVEGNIAETIDDELVLKARICSDNTSIPVYA